MKYETRRESGEKLTPPGRKGITRKGGIREGESIRDATRSETGGMARSKSGGGASTGGSSGRRKAKMEFKSAESTKIRTDRAR